jgi:hypothetical protein
MSPTPVSITREFVERTARSGLNVHHGNGMITFRDAEDDQILKTEPYKPSRNAEELSVRIHDYLVQWYGLADVIQAFGKTNFNNFMNGIKKVFDDWDNDR